MREWPPIISGYPSSFLSVWGFQSLQGKLLKGIVSKKRLEVIKERDCQQRNKFCLITENIKREFSLTKS